MKDVAEVDPQNTARNDGQFCFQFWGNCEAVCIFFFVLCDESSSVPGLTSSADWVSLSNDVTQQLSSMRNVTAWRWLGFFFTILADGIDCFEGIKVGLCLFPRIFLDSRYLVIFPVHSVTLTSIFDGSFCKPKHISIQCTIVWERSLFNTMLLFQVGCWTKYIRYLHVFLRDFTQNAFLKKSVVKRTLN